MARLTFEVEMAAPPDRVFAFFAPQRMPYWYGAEMEVEAEFEVERGAADFAVGRKARVAGRLAGREVSLTAVVTRYEPQRALEWEFLDAHGVRGRQLWELAPSGAGTRLRMEDDYALPGRLGRIADALFTRHAVARRDRAWLEKLRRLAEGAA
jgi:uncharacterized protein YndB with AHSA1/START domain